MQMLDSHTFNLFRDLIWFILYRRRQNFVTK